MSNPFITGETLGGTRSDHFYVGFDFTVGAADISVTDLGRWVISGNTGNHNVAILTSNGQTILASANVNVSGAPAGAFFYAALGSPVTLTAGTNYILAVDENLGDVWYNELPVTTTADATINFSRYNGSGAINGVAVWQFSSAGSKTFSLPNFKIASGGGGGGPWPWFSDQSHSGGFFDGGL